MRIHNVAVIWRGSFGIHKFGVRWELRGRDLRQSKVNLRFNNTSQYKGLLYLSPFGRNSVDNLRRQNWTSQFGELKGGRGGGVENVAIKVLTHIIIRLLSTSYPFWRNADLLHTDRRTLFS